MEESFKSGYDYVADTLAGNLGAQMSGYWMDSVNNEVNDMVERMIQTAAQKNSSADYTQGFMAEDWHAHTLNINAKIHHSRTRAVVPDDNTFGSADIQLGYKSLFDKFIAKKDFSLKYYKDASSSYRAQAETPHGSYNTSHQGESQQQYYIDRNVDSELSEFSMYFGQGKIIPADQLEKARDLLTRKIARESANGKIDLVKRYKEVLDTLDSVISDGKGNSSLELTREQAQKLAVAAKQGNIDKELLKECGLDIRQLVTPADIMNEAFRAGLSAAMISLVITIAPLVVNGISALVSSGEIDAEQLKELGIKSLSGSAKGFINGSITATIVAACKSGYFGELLLDTNPSIVSACVIMTVSTIESALKLATGKISKAEFASEITQMSFTTAFSVVGGIALSAILPKAIAPLSYMLGSFIGSIIGGFIYNKTEKVLISYCVESGCTFFGLVEQNYELPKEVLEELDVNIVKPLCFEYERFDFIKFKPNEFVTDEFSYEKIGINILSRGMIEAYSIGYA